MENLTDDDVDALIKAGTTEDLWTCFTCEFIGYPSHEHEDDDECCCPVCGTHEGDGFGMYDNDPRYRPSEQNQEDLTDQNAKV